MKKIIGLIILIALLFIGYHFYNNREILNGTIETSNTCFLMDFDSFNKTENSFMQLSSGDILIVESNIESGSVDLYISELYQGNDLENGTFEIGVLKDCIYEIRITGKHASGYVHISVKE